MSRLISDANGNTYIYNENDGTVTPVNQPSPEEQLQEVAEDAGKDVIKGEIKDKGKEYLSGLLGSGGTSAGSAAANFGAAGTAAAESAGLGQLSSMGLTSGSLESLAASQSGALSTGAPMAAPGLFEGSLLGEGSMGLGTIGLGIGGAATLYDLAKNREQIGSSKGYLKGIGGGAAAGFALGGPIGAGIGGLAGLAANAFGIGGKSRTKIEEDARKRLESEGIVVPNSGVKEWELNDKFKQSRNEADLTGKDIMHGAEFYGYKGYDKLDAAKQEAIANEALKRGLVREHHGTIDVSMDKAYEDYLKSQLGGGESTGGGGDTRRYQAEAKKDRKRAQLAAIMPEINRPIASPNRYDIDLSPIYKNPYL